MSFPAFLDTCVLYGAVLSDTLLRLAEHDTYRPHWSQCRHLNTTARLGLAIVSRFHYPFAMNGRVLARDALWEIAETQHGFVTAPQAREVGVSKEALQMLVSRGTLQRATFGVYRFPHYPVSPYDPYMVAVLWTRAPEACLSHETALDAYGISDVNPGMIHVTVARHRRLRRSSGEGYVVHRQDLTPQQVGWWQEIPTVTPATAIAQCITDGTPTYLLRQALERGYDQGYLTAADRDILAGHLEGRHAD